MDFQKTPIQGLMLVTPQKHGDSRGYFMETYRKDLFEPYIGNIEFVQDNESFSRYGTLRGLHLQKGAAAQAKLVRVVSGEIFDVAVDLRQGSPTLGQWFGTRLSADNSVMMYIPRGLAHGFLVLSETAHFLYKTDNYYCPEAEVTIAFDDPDLGIKWPEITGDYLMSERDRTKALSLAQFLK